MRWLRLPDRRSALIFLAAVGAAAGVYILLGLVTLSGYRVIVATLLGVAVREALTEWLGRRDSEFRLLAASRAFSRDRNTVAELTASLWTGEVWVPVSEPVPADPVRWFRWRLATRQTDLRLFVLIDAGGPLLPAFVRERDLLGAGYNFGVRIPFPELCAQLDDGRSTRVQLACDAQPLMLRFATIAAFAKADRELGRDRPRADTLASAVQLVERTLTPESTE
jgi:hypothetical protein